ncbi:Glucan endo-1,3-beta-glucosidase [Capsicum annuum]|nr:Glucan endo-1,3-beta-glucosidase [Capsicum annuum]
MALLFPFTKCSSVVPLVALFVLFICGLQMTGVHSVGVCYGKIADNLPSDSDVVNHCHANGINKIRLYYPDTNVLNALRGSNIEVLLDVPVEHVKTLAQDPNQARIWVNNNIKAYFPSVRFKYIAVGNEISPIKHVEFAPFVGPAIENVHNAIVEAGLQGQIKVSTATYSALLTNTWPPQNSIFNPDWRGFTDPIVKLLKDNNLPLLVNIYPYFSYIYNTKDIPLSYALFTDSGRNSAGYQNLFDALVDSMYYALEKSGAPNVEIVVSETGWPSYGHPAATTDNARTYYRNLINHVRNGTPKKSGRNIETFLFAMFDENRKGGDETERHFGLFYPDRNSKYDQLNFNN